MKSPAKEKDLKDAELKPQVPPKDAGVSETAPQIPEPTSTATAEPVAEPIAADTPVDAAEPTMTQGKPAESAKEVLDPLSPKSEKKAGFLSGLPFMKTRDRSVSPSAAVKDTPAKVEDAPAVPPKESETLASEPLAAESTPAAAETALTEPTPAAQEPIAPVHDTPAAVDPVPETPASKIDEAKPVGTTDATSPTSNANKRQSVLGNLGRRASKAFKGMQTPKKENAAPTTTATEPKIDEPKVSEPVAEKPVTNGESKIAEPEQPNSIGDVSSDAIHVGQAQSTPTVAASA